MDCNRLAGNESTLQRNHVSTLNCHRQLLKQMCHLSWIASDTDGAFSILLNKLDRLVLPGTRCFNSHWIKHIVIIIKWVNVWQWCLWCTVLPQASEYTDDEGVRFTLDVPPPSSRAISIAGSYHCSWKPRSNHFQSHADFKPKGLQSLTSFSV